MRNGLLGSLLVLILAGAQSQVQAQAKLGPPVADAVLLAPEPALQFPHTDGPLSPPEAPWQPPRTELDDRPNVGPGGYRFYGALDYILWWTERDRPVPVLFGNPAEHTGSSALSEGGDLGALARNGVRGTLGTWLNQEQSVGLELGGFWTADRSTGDKYPADDLGVHGQLHSQLAGSEVQLRMEVYRGTWAHLDLLGGFRYLGFDEGLDATQRDLTSGLVSSDRCGTRNNFYGGQVGAEMELHRNKAFLDIWGKAALGANDETINLNGTTLDGGQTLPGGTAVSPALVGQYRRDEFAVVPEVGCNVGYHLTQHLRVLAGYTFLYLSDAVRPSEQLDALSHTPRPTGLPVQNSDLWIQGLNLGVEFRF